MNLLEAIRELRSINEEEQDWYDKEDWTEADLKLIDIFHPEKYSKKARQAYSRKYAEKHFREGDKSWRKYFNGKLKDIPGSWWINRCIDKLAYLFRWDELEGEVRARKRIASSLDDVDKTIEITYRGDLKDLIKWLSTEGVITSITASPARNSGEEGEQGIKDILDAIKQRGGDVSKVSIGKEGGEMRNYTMHLAADALDACPDKKAFLTWTSPKFDMNKGEEIEALTFDQKSNDISSRRVVLDYLLNKDNYLNGN